MNRCISISLIFALCINLISIVIFILLDTESVNKALFISYPDPSNCMQKSRFNISKPGDVMVFFHIQKTGGSSFESDLVTNIKVHNCSGEKIKLNKSQRIVSRNHKCFKRNSTELWLLTRRTVGWPCGAHPDYITLKLCAPLHLSSSFEKREWNLFFITLLRNPVTRFISEYLHVTRGANWPVYKKSCSHSARHSWLNLETLPYPCEFMDRDRVNLTLDEFLSCPKNPAINRMSRMLSENFNFGCTRNSSIKSREKKKLMLESAKLNLEKMDYFGILDYFVESKELFEATFSFQYSKTSQYIPSHGDSYELSSKQRNDIEVANYLDVQLYEWAVKLFKCRLRAL